MVKTTLSGNRFELEARQETSGIGWTLKNTDEDMTDDDMTTRGHESTFERSGGTARTENWATAPQQWTSASKDVHRFAQMAGLEAGEGQRGLLLGFADPIWR